ncbi:MAG TPA: alkaline phosphatase D family protein [Sphingomonas sp.]|uniref:alkaline phosphatase D family protein n=1 Tax=Sphingomonas sp. TaxID=28214 RepID=UPI002ED816CF
MGPVLALERSDARQWHLTAVLVSKQRPSDLVIDIGGAEVRSTPEAIWSNGGRFAYRFRFAVPLEDAASRFDYSVDDRTFTVSLPARGHAPTMAYASCNGFSSAKVMKGVKDKNAMWSRMAAEHARSPYHLLLLGGDQVYADTMWDTVPELRRWARLPYDAGNAAEATSEMVSSVEEFFFDLYTDRWSQPEIATMMASVPMVAMWDDHDLMDGWGSYPEPRQRCDVFQKAVWPAARKAFRVFQQHLADGEFHASSIAADFGYSRGHIVGPLAILALDMRSERTDRQVLSPPHWNDVFGWLDKVGDAKHLMVMSSIPVVYPGFDTLERLLGALPGHQDLEDDLRDHWNSRPHKGERLRLIHRLLQLSQDEEVRSTILSGDVHVAALGVIESSRGQRGHGAVINQMISSGVVHPGPGGVVLFALRHLFDSTDEIDRGIAARMVDFPGTQDRFIGRRNYLSLEPDEDGRLDRIWANWFVENEREPYTKVIHALRKTRDEEVVQSTTGVAPTG